MATQSKRLDEQFAFKGGEPIVGNLNKALTAIESRLQGTENKAAEFDSATDRLITVGLARINDYLQPAIDRIAQLFELGFMLAHSATLVALAEGPLSMVVTEGPERDLFVPAPFLVVQRTSDQEDYAIAQFSSYNRVTGIVNMIVLSAFGDLAAHDDWTIICTAGVSEATRQFSLAAQAARDAADADAATVLAAVATALSARDLALTYRDAAAASATSAGTSETNAAASATAAAASAASISPTSFVKRDNSQPHTSVATGVAPVGGSDDTSFPTTAWVRTWGLTLLTDSALTGNPTAATQTAGNNTTRLATTAFVQAAITALINAAPGTLDTLNELAAALGNDANFATTTATSLSNRVRVDAAQSLTTTQQEQARSNIYAAPFDALAFNGMQINGDMAVGQLNVDNAPNLVSGGAYNIVDCWYGSYISATMVVQGSRIAPPGSPSFGGAFRKCAQLKSTTGAALGAGDLVNIRTSIEGLRTSRLAFGAAGAGAVAIGFWVYATISGVLTVSLRNSARNRSYLVNITINSANTWEYKTAVILGDVTGTWLNDTGIGLDLCFCFGGGATWQGTNASWQAGNFIATSATTNFFASNNNVACLTGVTVHPGLEVPSAARSPYLVRPYAENEDLCLRYIEKSYDLGVLPGASVTDGLTAVGYSTAYGNLGFSFKKNKRVAPTMTGYASDGTVAKWKRYNDLTFQNVAFSGVYTKGVRFVSVTGATDIVEGHWVAQADLG